MTKKTKKPADQAKVFNSVIKYLAIFIVVVVLIALLSANKAGQPYPYKTWNMNETVQDKKLSFTTTSTKEDPIGAPGFWAPAPDETFLIINMSYKNKTNEVYHLSPINYMKLKDNNNQEFPVTSAPSLTQGFGGPVNPGETMTGQVGFIVKKSSKGLKLIFDPHLVNENIIEVSLNK